MSFHGDVIGTSLGIFYFAHKEKLSWLRIHDYVACCVPFGLFFGRLANFINQELWGAQTTVPWAVRFVEATPYGNILGPPRHPSQLYEAILEGLVLFAILWWMFWKTDARYQPGKLVGTFALRLRRCSASASSISRIRRTTGRVRAAPASTWASG